MGKSKFRDSVYRKRLVWGVYFNCVQRARVSKNAKFQSQARMFLMSGSVLVVGVLSSRASYIHVLSKVTFLKKNLACFSTDWHVFNDFCPIFYAFFFKTWADCIHRKKYLCLACTYLGSWGTFTTNTTNCMQVPRSSSHQDFHVACMTLDVALFLLREEKAEANVIAVCGKLPPGGVENGKRRRVARRKGVFCARYESDGGKIERKAGEGTIVGKKLRGCEKI